MTPFARAVRAEVMRAFRRDGVTPTTESIAATLECEATAVGAAFEELAQARALVLHPGSHRIWMAHPFSAVPTPHRVSIGAQRWYANCIWDGFALMALLGDGTMETRFAGDGARAQYAVRDGVVSGEGVVHFLVPPAEFWVDIGFT